MHTLEGMYLNRHVPKNKRQAERGRQTQSHPFPLVWNTNNLGVQEGRSGFWFCRGFPCTRPDNSPKACWEQAWATVEKHDSRDGSQWQHGYSTFVFALLETTEQVAQSFSTQESLPSSSCLTTFPLGKSFLGFSETSGLFLDEEAPPSNRLHFSQQQDNQNMLLLVVECSWPHLKPQVHFTFGASGQWDLFWNTGFTAGECFITIIIALSTRVPSFGSLWPPFPLVS